MIVFVREMQTMKIKGDRYGKLVLVHSLAAVFLALTVLLAAPAKADERGGQKSFLSPQEAATALVAAVGAGDDADLLAVLGPDAEELISSGDSVADQRGRERFLKAYAEKHQFEEQAGEEHAVLLIGSKDYPFPIPLVRRGGGWIFDTPAGKEEILNRRIGRNELRAIEVMQVYNDAQRDFSCSKRAGGASEFAQKFVSSVGKKDGLYWPAEEGGPQSPLGPLLARAASEGYTNGLGEKSPEPYHGYFFKILKSQGTHAVGGAFDYVVEGKMVLGFALVAYPARYGASGIMTFISNQEGVIYEKDLGEETASLAAAMTSFDPDPSWHRYEETDRK